MLKNCVCKESDNSGDGSDVSVNTAVWFADDLWFQLDFQSFEQPPG
jgi:hypothetical protein